MTNILKSKIISLVGVMLISLTTQVGAIDAGTVEFGVDGAMQVTNYRGYRQLVQSYPDNFYYELENLYEINIPTRFRVGIFVSQSISFEWAVSLVSASQGNTKGTIIDLSFSPSLHLISDREGATFYIQPLLGAKLTKFSNRQKIHQANLGIEIGNKILSSRSLRPRFGVFVITHFESANAIPFITYGFRLGVSFLNNRKQ